MLEHIGHKIFLRTVEKRNLWIKLKLKLKLTSSTFPNYVRIDRFSESGNLSQRTFSQKLFNRSTKNSIHNYDSKDFRFVHPYYIKLVKNCKYSSILHAPLLSPHVHA